MQAISSTTDNIRRVLITLMLSIFGLSSAHAVTVHRALVIGLGEYEDPSWSKINGDNDVKYVVSMLRQMGYTDIKTLRNQQATKFGIVTALKTVAARCRKGDEVYIHYSGHGQLMTDINGDEATRWKGSHAQWDEAIIPYDAYMTYCTKDRGEKHISDDELSKYLTEIRRAIGRKGKLTVVLDACHSGDATRGEDEEVIRGVDTKFCIPRTPDTPTEAPIPELWLTISACQPYQMCSEIKEKRVGRLTYALYSLGGKIFKIGKKDMERYLEKAIKKFPSRLPQTPMVTGRR